MGLVALATVYPWQTMVGFAVIVAMYFGGRHIQREKQRDRLFGLDVLTLSPTDYEHHCAQALSDAGWSVTVTKASGDQGVDVLAELRGIKAAIQCKRYGKAVGNAAVQQVDAGRRHYRAQLAVVVAPSGFTIAAHALAQSNGVLLMSERELPRLAALARVP